MAALCRIYVECKNLKAHIYVLSGYRFTMKPEKIEEGKWVLHERMHERIFVKFDFLARNRKIASILWISMFIAFGPLQILLHNSSYVGSVIFGHNPFAYFITQGLFVATFSAGCVYLISAIMNRSLQKKKKLHIT